MIVRTAFRIARDITQPIKINFATTPKINYEHFFKIQKSSNPIEAIRVYDQYREENAKHDQFIAITLRILTRSMRVGENDDPEAVKGFFLRNLSRIKRINMKSLGTEYIKDIIIFYINFAQHFELKQQQTQILNLYLSQFLVRFNQASSQKQIELYSIVIFLSIPLIYRYSQVYYEQYLKIVVQLLEDNPSGYIRDHDDFQKILNIFPTFEHFNHPTQKQIILFVFQKLRELKIAQCFTEKRVVALLTCILHMKKTILAEQQCAKLIGLVYQQVERAFLEIFSTVKMYNFSRIIPILLQQRPESPILNTFYGIILKSIDQQFQCKIDPRVVVMGISFLSRHHFYRYLSHQWAGDFVKMVGYYHQRNDLFFDGIIQKIFAIISNKILDQHSSFELYRIIFDKIDESQKGVNRKTIKKLIMASIMHSKYGRLTQAQQNLLKANAHFRADQKQRNNSLKSDTVDLHAYYTKICTYQQNQPTMLSGFPDKHKSTIAARRVKFVTDLMCMLFTLKIELAYANFSHIEVENTLRHSEITRVKYIYNKQKVFKTIVFESKFSSIHFPNAVDCLLQLYGNSITLQQNMSQFIRRRIQLQKELSKQAVGLIYFFYSKHHQSEFVHLIGSEPHLLQLLLTYQFDETVQFVVRAASKSLLRQYGRTLLLSIIHFGTVNLDRASALKLFSQITTAMSHINDEQNKEIYSALMEFSFRHCICYQAVVDQPMQQYSTRFNQSTSGRPSWLQQKQQFVAKLQPSVRWLIQNQNNKQVSAQDSLAVFKQALTQIESKDGPSSLKMYLAMLQSYLHKQQAISISSILFTLKNMALKQAQSTKLFFRFAITHRLFWNELNQTLFDKLSRQLLPSQFDYFTQLSLCPIPKAESALYSFTQQTTLDPIEYIVPFCVAYSLVANPTPQMRQFATKLCSRYRKQIPLFFKIYLSEIDTEAASLILIGEKPQLDPLAIDTSGDNTLSVGQKSVKAIFEQDGISTANWWNIDNNSVQQGVYLLITRKILQHRHPNKEIHFTLSQPVPRQLQHL